MDSRNIRNGNIIPTENYCDQPYLVVADDGAWVVTVTTGVGDEGEAGEHVISMRSTDRGQTWSEPVDLEPADGPESAYSVLLKSPKGRIFCFYNHNTDNLRQVKGDFPGGYWNRVDSLGHYVFRYSDDCGQSWSSERIEIPMRLMQMDRENPYGGSIRFFWNVGRPLKSGNEVFLTIHRIGSFGAKGGYTRSEGILLHSTNLFDCDNPAEATWETLPDGEIGLRSPEGPIAEEQCLTELSDGSLFCVYRTVAGSAAFAYSRDRGHTWTEPEFMRYPDGRRMKHGRAANFVWKLQDGRFLYWFHNQGGKDYDGRNPAWISLGRETDALDGRRIEWSDPEILLYDDEWQTRISYPDFLELDGKYYVSQTQKTVARINELDSKLMEGLLNPMLPKDGMPLGTHFEKCETGFTLSLTANINSGSLLRISNPQGFVLEAEVRENRVYVMMDDGECAVNAWSAPLKPGDNRIAVIVDAQAKIIRFVTNGVLWDGGERRRGWFRLPVRLADGEAQVNTDVIWFKRPLLTCEAVLITQ